MAAGIDFPMDPDVRRAMTAVRASCGPLTFDPASEFGPPPAVSEEYSIRSMLCMAIYPRTDKAYMFGLHQCCHPRVWTEDEKTLFEAIGRRLADGLTSLTSYRDLRDREGQLSALVQTIPDLVWMKDANGVFLRCNPQFERFVGVAESEIVGKTDHDLFDKDRAEFFLKSDREIVTTGKPYTGEGWLTFAAGGYRGYFEAIKTPMRDRAGKPIGVLGIARDITERAKAEEQLRIAAAAFEVHEGIVIVGADGRILRVNRAFTKITGYTTGDVVGKAPAELRSGEHDPALYQAIWDRLGREGTWQGEILNRRKCGEVFPSWLTAAAVKRDNGEITHYVATLIDITERKAAEKQIEHLAYYDTLDSVAQPSPVPRPSAAGARRLRAQRAKGGAFVHRSRQLQDPQRDRWPRRGRPIADRGLAADRRLRAQRRHRRPPRRRRVRRAPRRIERVHPGGRRAGEGDRRKDSGRAQSALRRRWAPASQRSEHRRHAVHRRRRFARRTAQAGRHRDVPGEIGGAQHAALLRPRDARRARRPDGSGVPLCGSPFTIGSSSCIISRRSTAPAASSAPRRCCVGAAPSAAWFRRASSSLWLRKPG